MRFRIGFNTDQHLPWETLLERWLLLEKLGFDSAWVADHLMPWWTDDEHRAHQQVPWDDGVGGDDTDLLEGWTLLSALLARTSTIQGGMLVSNNLFRHPALVAKMAATLDQVSGSRFSLGMGAGWFEDEHTVYGFDFPSPGERVTRLDESLTIITGLMREERTTFEGQYYHVTNAPFAPRPAAGSIPIVIGGNRTRMLGLTARYADVWSAQGSPDEVAARGRVLDDACRAIDRDPREIRWSHYAYNSILGGDPFASVEAFRAIVEPYRTVGISEVIYELPDRFDERVLESIVRELLPEWNVDAT